MNKVGLMGRLTREPDIRWTQGQDQKCMARFTLAVDRRVKQEGQQDADFISCIAFGKLAEFVEKYLMKGSKIILWGRIQTGKYQNRDGVTVYYTDAVAEEIEFAESKAEADERAAGSEEQRAAGHGSSRRQQAPDSTGFETIPDGIDEELPFS